MKVFGNLSGLLKIFLKQMTGRGKADTAAAAALGLLFVIIFTFRFGISVRPLPAILVPNLTLVGKK